MKTPTTAKPKTKRRAKIRVEPQPEPRLYFAYGSNLNLAQFKRRCPGAKRLGKLIVPDYRLVFRGVADIEPYFGAKVPGAVYTITPACERALDRYEGFPFLYRKSFLTVSVQRENGERDVLPLMFYQMNRDKISMPSDGYAGTIRQGYSDWKLDPQFLEEAIQHAHLCEMADAQTDDEDEGEEEDRDDDDYENERGLDPRGDGQMRFDLRAGGRAPWREPAHRARLAKARDFKVS